MEYVNSNNFFKLRINKRIGAMQLFLSFNVRPVSKVEKRTLRDHSKFMRNTGPVKFEND